MSATDTLKEDDRRTILNQLKSLSDQIYAEGNADFSGRTVFTGYRTTEQLTFKTDEETTSYTIDQKLSYKDISEARYTYGSVDVPTDATNSFDETISIGENTYDRLRLAYGKINGKRGGNKPIIHNRRKVLYEGEFGRNPQTDRILE